MNDKSLQFKNRLIKHVISIVNLGSKLKNTPANQIFVKQIIRSSSSIRANYQEAQVSLTRKEFIHKLNISLKEANETDYWLELIETSNKLALINYKKENLEIIKILTSITKTSSRSD